MQDKIINNTRVAELLDMQPSTFNRRRNDLEKAGFPRRLPVIKKYSENAVQDWIDRMSGRLKPTVELESDMLRERINGRQKSALHN